MDLLLKRHIIKNKSEYDCIISGIRILSEALPNTIHSPDSIKILNEENEKIIRLSNIHKAN